MGSHAKEVLRVNVESGEVDTIGGPFDGKFKWWVPPPPRDSLSVSSLCLPLSLPLSLSLSTLPPSALVNNQQQSHEASILALFILFRFSPGGWGWR